MASNTWTFSGSILKWNAKQGTKNGQPAPWGKMWIRIQLDAIQTPDGLIDNNIIFLQVPLAYGDDPKAPQSQTLIDSLNVNQFILVRDAKVDKIKRWRKNDAGGFDEYLETGIRAYPSSIRTRPSRYNSFNKGLVAGKVLKQASNQLIVAEPYMIPGKAGRKAEWKNREIPLVIPEGKGVDLVDQQITAYASLSGIGPTGNNSVCGYAESFIYDT